MIDLIHLIPIRLEKGSVILPGNWGRVVRDFGWHHSAAVREMSLEAARMRLHPDFPSRLDVAYACPCPEAAKAFRDAALMQGPNNAYSLHLAYRVSLVDPTASTVLCSWSDVSPIPGSQLSPNWADRYWETAARLNLESDLSGFENMEVLTMSPLRIVERIDI